MRAALSRNILAFFHRVNVCYHVVSMVRASDQKMHGEHRCLKKSSVAVSTRTSSIGRQKYQVWFFVSMVCSWTGGSVSHRVSLALQGEPALRYHSPQICNAYHMRNKIPLGKEEFQSMKFSPCRAKELLMKRVEWHILHTPEVTAFHSGSVSHHCKSRPVLLALLPAWADTRVISRQGITIYMMISLRTTCLVRVSHPHDPQDVVWSNALHHPTP